jgi:dephospho-CoA kinase
MSFEGTVEAMARTASLWILTGGLGSGKSTVARMLGERGATVIDADLIGHEILEPGGAAFGRVSSRWPSTVVDGTIDRGRLAMAVFSDPAELEVLEAITHPEIARILSDRVRSSPEGVVIVEVSVPKVWDGPEARGRIVVDAPDRIRLGRAIARGMPEGDARSRMAAQPAREEWLELGDLIVVNDGSLRDLETRVDQLWEALSSEV